MQCLEGEGQDQEQQKELPRTAAHPDGLQAAAFRSCLSSSPMAGACVLISSHPCSAASKATGGAGSVPLQELGQGPFLIHGTPVLLHLSQPKETGNKHIFSFQSRPRARLQYYMAQFLAYLHFVFLLQLLFVSRHLGCLMICKALFILIPLIY